MRPGDASDQHLYYVYDPMCAWCWGYRPTLLRVEAWLKQNSIAYSKILGGLAPDSDTGMPLEMQERIEGYWRRIHSLLGTSFNHEFWKVAKPRRSTYPACRAALIARDYDKEDDMNYAIQRAYYLESKNPSDNDVLCTLAEALELPIEQFREQLTSPTTSERLLGEIQFARSIGGNSFPSWILMQRNQVYTLDLNYQDETVLQSQILKLIRNPNQRDQIRSDHV